MGYTAEIASVVTQHIVPEYADALTKANALWKHLTTEGKYKVSGGTLIQFPIKLIANSSSGFIAGSGATISVNPSVQLQYGTLNWKYYNYNVNFSLEEFTQTQNAEEAVLDYMEAKKDGAIADAIREQTAALHSTASSLTLQYNGLLDVVAASGTSYAGLLDTDYSTGAYLPVLDTTSANPNYATINSLIQKARARAQQTGVSGSYDVNFGLWNEAVQEKFLTSAQAQQRFYESKMLDTGFEGVKVNGVNFYMDAYTPGTKDGSTADNYAYVFPIKVMKMAYKYGLGSASPFDGEVRIPNQPVMSNQFYMSGNLVCVNRRLVAVAKALVA